MSNFADKVKKEQRNWKYLTHNNQGANVRIQKKWNFRKGTMEEVFEI